MANHKSALKRARQSEIRRARNKATKTRVKNVTKGVRVSIQAADIDQASKNLDTAKSVLGKAVKSGVIHERTAARKISRLSRMLNAHRA